MKINNKRIIPYIYIIYSIIATLFVVFIVMKIFPLKIFHTNLIYLLPLVGVVLLIFIKLRGYQLFEYDSDGEALNFSNDNCIKLNISSTKRRSEFPKRKLKSYKITNNLFKKSLKMTMTSKRSNTGYSKLEYDLTYLSKNEFKGLKKSLDKVLDENKKGLNDI